MPISLSAYDMRLSQSTSRPRMALSRKQARSAVLLGVLLLTIIVYFDFQGDTTTTAERRIHTPSTPFWSWFTRYTSGRYTPTFEDVARYAQPVPGRGPPRRQSRPVKNHGRRFPHPGVSRTETSPGVYNESALPSLEQAFAHLSPLLNNVKERVPAVPREHILDAPLFPPFLTKDLVDRYAHLQQEYDEEKREFVPGTEQRILLVSVCRQVAGMLADWYATWTVLADFLGPESLIISVQEGDSEDGSAELLDVLREHLLYIGVPPGNIFVKTNLPKVDWDSGHRIEMLADMRNAAMEPIFASKTPHLSPDGKPWSAVLFHNDVYLSATHFLELLHQHFTQDADMTCGWDHAGKWFYDGWVGRDMSGDLYSPFPVPEEDEPKPAKFFVSSPQTKQRFDRTLPFQVFAGWNGAAVMTPTPFLPPYNVRFRRGTPRAADVKEGQEECQASESAFISWDFWKYGFGRIMTVPGVHFTYGKGDAQRRGWVDFPRPGDGYEEKIDWIEDPPTKVRCHDWPDKPGKGHWAWDKIRWVDPPALEIPDGAAVVA